MLQLVQDQARSSAAPPSLAAGVSVIIVVWNAKRYVLECLESLRNHCRSVCTEVIVVDNASTDGTPDLVAELFPEFILIRNPENYGFAKANNIGILQSTGDVVCLVNSDVVFTDDCISPLLRYLSQNPAVAMVGPRMLDAGGIVRRSTMRFPTIWNSFCRSFGLDLVFRRSRLFGGLLMNDFDHQHTRRVEVLNGWFVAVRRSAMDSVGLLDDRFFIYGEDVDWCYRFHQAGHQMVLLADAAAIHYGGSSSSSAPLRFSLEMHRANAEYWRKHHGWFAQELFLISIAVFHLGRLLGYAFSYPIRPAQRQSLVSRMQRSLACLRWTAQAISGNAAAGHAHRSPTN